MPFYAFMNKLQVALQYSCSRQRLQFPEASQKQSLSQFDSFMKLETIWCVGQLGCHTTVLPTFNVQGQLQAWGDEFTLSHKQNEPQHCILIPH